MKKDDFAAGALAWFAGPMTADKLEEYYLIDRKWDDGFAAFANGEVRLHHLGGPADLAGLLSGSRLQEREGLDREKFPDLEGFLMEAGLWHRQNGPDGGELLEELAVEREGEEFFVQHWRLVPGKTAGKGELSCWWRPAAAFVRGNLKRLFPEGEIATREVIVPRYRLRFYLTEGGVK